MELAYAFTSFFFPSHDLAKCLLCSFQNCSPQAVINFVVDCNTCLYSSFSSISEIWHRNKTSCSEWNPLQSRKNCPKWKYFNSNLCPMRYDVSIKGLRSRILVYSVCHCLALIFNLSNLKMTILHTWKFGSRLQDTTNIYTYFKTNIVDIRQSGNLVVKISSTRLVNMGLILPNYWNFLPLASHWLLCAVPCTEPVSRR